MSLMLLSKYATAFTSSSIKLARPISASFSPSTAFAKRFHRVQICRLMSTLSPDEISEVESQIKAKGDQIRQLKSDGIDKADLAPHVAELLSLKAKLEPPKEEKPKKEAKQKKKGKQKQPAKKKETDMSESELRQARLDKVQAMREAGVEPYAYTYDPTHSASELQALYEGKLEGGEEDEDSDVAVAGRIMAKRVFGKLAFFTLQDESGTIQLHLEKNRLGDTFKVGLNTRVFFIRENSKYSFYSF